MCAVSAGWFCPSETKSADGTKCPAGYYCTGKATGKTACAGGTASAVEGATSIATCAYCQAGTSAPVGSSVCELCEPGTVASALGSATCQKCDPGSFSDKMGTVSCTACPTGKTSAEGSVSRDGCTDIVVVGSSQTSVVLDVVLPYSRETFTEPVQSKFRIGMAAAATAGCRCEVTKNEVIITNIQAPAAAPGTRRQTRLSAAYAGITVGVSILVPNLEAGTLLVQSGALSKEGINKELDKLQVERVTSVSSPALSSSASNGNNSTSSGSSSGGQSGGSVLVPTIIGVVVGVVVPIAMAVVALRRFRRKKTVTPSERSIISRIKAAAEMLGVEFRDSGGGAVFSMRVCGTVFAVRVVSRTDHYIHTHTQLLSTSTTRTSS